MKNLSFVCFSAWELLHIIKWLHAMVWKAKLLISWDNGVAVWTAEQNQVACWEEMRKGIFIFPTSLISSANSCFCFGLQDNFALLYLFT